MNEFVYNVIDTAVAKLNSLKVTSKFNDMECVIVSDEHDVSYYISACLALINKKRPDMRIHIIVDKDVQNVTFLNQVRAEFETIQVWNSLDEYFHRGNIEDSYSEMFFDVVNLRNDKYLSKEARDAKENEILQILEHNLENKENVFQLVDCIPSIEMPLPDVTHAIAEREYEVIFRDYPEDSLEKYVIKLEDIIRPYTEKLKFAQVVRVDRLFGPGIEGNENIWINEILEDVINNGLIKLSDKDRHDFASAAYIKDALVQILLASVNGRHGNIYNVSSWEISRFQIVSNIYESFPDKNIVLETEHGDWDGKPDLQYRMLNARKIRLTHRTILDKTLYTRKADAIKSTALYFFGVERYIPKSDINVYYGRMNRIREIELEILKEVDAICKAYDIQYFLAAGTMLGAVRHNEFIPWDDDVDIGMLPEDYEKFLKVCPEHLSVDYGYQSYSTELTSHYIHDKIRLKNSFFSTKYSDKYPMMNGVYIDVFIYHKTSDNPRKQQRHIRKIQIMRRIIGIRWADRPRKNMHYYFSKVALPIMRLFPFMTLHKIYTRILRKYENKNTHYRIDGTGFNLKKVGAFPDEWFHGTIEHEFCGYKFPILAHYDEYLTHWYSEHYMELLPLSGRKSVHDVVRIDLGQNLFEETKHDKRFRDVDLRGELYETYK